METKEPVDIKVFSFQHRPVFQRIMPFLQNSLESAGKLEAMMEVSELFPLFSHVGFESILDTTAPGLDFLYCARRDIESQFLTTIGANKSMELMQSKNPVWAKIRDFADAWNCKNSKIWKNVPNIWLEFDFRRNIEALFSPSLFVKIYSYQQDQSFNNTSYGKNLSPSGYLETIQQVSEKLNLKLEYAIMKNIERCYNVFLNDIFSCETGFWLGRNTKCVRLVFMMKTVSRKRLKELLTLAGWPKGTDFMEYPWDNLWPNVNGVSLSLDISEKIAPTLGVEIYTVCPKEIISFSENVNRWESMTLALVHTKLCVTEKRKALLAWLGGIRVDQSDLKYFQAGKERYSGGDFIIRRNINHIKISYDPISGFQTKAYLSLTGLNRKEKDSND